MKIFSLPLVNKTVTNFINSLELKMAKKFMENGSPVERILENKPSTNEFRSVDAMLGWT